MFDGVVVASEDDTSVSAVDGLVAMVQTCKRGLKMRMDVDVE